MHRYTWRSKDLTTLESRLRENGSNIVQSGADHIVVSSDDVNFHFYPKVAYALPSQRVAVRSGEVFVPNASKLGKNDERLMQFFHHEYKHHNSAAVTTYLAMSAGLVATIIYFALR